jgi:hypothetical protein
VLADVGRDVSIAAGHPVQGFQHRLRLDQLAGFVVRQALLRAPGVDARPPSLERFAVRRLAELVERGHEVFQHGGHGADDRHVHLHVLGDRGRVDVDMDDARVRAEGRKIARDAVIEARTHGQQHVAFVHGHVGLDGAVHAEHAKKLRVVRRVGAKAHQRVGDRETQPARELRQLRRALAQHHAAAGVDHRPPGLDEQLRRLANLPRVALEHRVVGAHLDLFGVHVARAVGGHVLRHVHHHRAGAAGGRDVERLAQRERQIRHVLDQEVVLHARAGNADRVGFLKRVVADQVRRYLAGDHHHRDRVHVRGGDAGHGVGGAGAGRDQHHARLTGGARVAVGRVRGRLLVAHQDVLDVLLAVQGVVDVQHGATRVAEYVPHALIAQETDDDFGAGEFHVGLRMGGTERGAKCPKKRPGRIADLPTPTGRFGALLHSQGRC